MKVLVINGGSSSLKYQVIEMDTETCICKGIVESIGKPYSSVTHEKAGAEKIKREVLVPDHAEALKQVLQLLCDNDTGVIKDISEIKAIGHRVLHSGGDFDDSVLIDDEVIQICKKNIVMGPLHMPANIGCIETCKELFPGVPMTAVFDTSFHHTMPDYAYMYGVPYEYYEQYRVRKYGFHGTSHKFISQTVSEILGKENCKKMITCHLGNGSSLAAIEDGKVLDTSMGFTPLEGVVMGTRSGDIDPAVVEYMANVKNLSVGEVLNILNKESGFEGIAGDFDCRILCRKAGEGDEKSKLVLNMFAYRVKKYIGSYVAAMNGVDVLVFAGGIGENSFEIREGVLKNLEYLGIELDENANKTAPRGTFAVISKPTSRVKIVVQPTNEELLIARDAVRLAKLK